ncbi:hypothetical protein ACFY2Z_41080 [Streptomyces sp. NPDC001222]|uniref:hypothetical protein n=1 Tax=Streptomyces sp. NPDC001222 TaxID=3364548 RepID=UPI003673A028
MSLEKNRSFRMAESLSKALDAVANGKGMNPSQVVRLAVAAYIRTATAELKFSNGRTAAVELSNAVQGDAEGAVGAGVSDADLAQAWDRFYSRR